MAEATLIRTPGEPALDELCEQLRALADELDMSGQWPERQLRLCGEYGVFRWFMPVALGGLGWSDADLVRGYLRLSAACLTTTFIITQRTGACRRIIDSANETAQLIWLPGLASGETFATVGISHLTTSRRHLARPAMSAEETDGGFVLDGFSPWVTGADHAEMIVTGGTLADGRQILATVPTALAGVSRGEPARLVALSASHTGEFRCQAVRITQDQVLDGPVENVMARGTGAGTGGLQTSTLAVGLASAAIDFLLAESEKRADLRAPAASLHSEQEQLTGDLLAMAEGNRVCSNEELRSRANGIALRASQAALTAAKGSGYVAGHPAGRWCREALFFLVWSCPQPVMNAALCELAGLGGDPLSSS
jgi:alkylation response protein AidB-like acyl-CoA dehydrogenase